MLYLRLLRISVFYLQCRIFAFPLSSSPCPTRTLSCSFSCHHLVRVQYTNLSYCQEAYGTGSARRVRVDGVQREGT
ncbi:hypothetical protein B0J11DRAFT_545474 [Dendryphion nanum]|uniref:Secreted protein n=1 Tax=Dendryphion nanum TaxID=256645 RepID=A0A9P9CWG1_9PLEO|nr:hypothetical protein B0J11DRAFT_545474 [Dendryphion nanum]